MCDVRRPEPSPADRHLASLAAVIRFGWDAGYEPRQIARGVLAGHQAGLREWAKIDPATAIRVADETREAVRQAIATLTDD